jgi:hypothetical protein
MLRVILVGLMVLCAASAMGVDRKDIGQVSTDEITQETQAVITTEGGQLHVLWWLPVEFWASALANDTMLTQQQKLAMLTTFEPYLVVAAGSAELIPFGATNFHTKERVGSNLTLVFIGDDGVRAELVPQEAMDPHLDQVLTQMKPILARAIGNLGNNIHFFTCDNRLEDSTLLVDAYESGRLEMSIMQDDGLSVANIVETPLNCLYIPRKCPNGKDAHVSWNFCPWTGEKLPK